MNGQDEISLTDYWHRETSSLNERVDDAFKAAQNHAYDLGWQRGVQQADSELMDALTELLELHEYEPDRPAVAAARTAIAKATAKGK